MRSSPVSICLAVLAALFSGTSDAQSVIDLGIPANDIAYSSQTGLLYAAVPSSAGIVYGNSLVEISPVDGSIIRSVFVGSEPATIGMSPDASVAYVGLSGASLIYPVDLETMTTGPSFSLGTTMFDGPRFASQIVVAAGSPGTVAVSRRNHGFSPNYEGIAVFDNGVMRPTTDNGFDGGNTIGFGSSPDVLYGYDNEDSDNKLERFTISSSGVELDTSVDNVMSGSQRIITRGDQIVGTSGQIVGGTTLELLGRYMIPGGGFSNAFVFDDSTESAVAVTFGEIYTFDRDRLALVKSFPAPATGSFATDAVICGRPACIAISYQSGNAVIVQDVRDIFSGTFE